MKRARDTLTLAEWMMRPEQVVVTTPDENGRQLATDRFVMIDLAELVYPESRTEPGNWRVMKNGTVRPDTTSELSKLDPANQGIPETLDHLVKRWRHLDAEDPDFGDDPNFQWYEVRWSDWTYRSRGYSDKLPYVRVGAMGPHVVAINDAWLSRLPAKYRLIGARPRGSLLILDDKDRPAGSVMPIGLVDGAEQAKAIAEWLR